MLVLVLSGKRYTGKDVTASLVKKYYPGSCEIAAIAQGCKMEYAETVGADFDRLMNDQKYKESHREGIIKIADDRRLQDSDYWIKKCLETDREVDLLVISDMRFEAEKACVKEYHPSALFVRIEARDETREKRGWSFIPPVDLSSTETAFDWNSDWDATIFNNGSISDLENLVEGLVSFLLLE